VFIPLQRSLKEKSAYLLRPKAPSNGSRIFLENVSFIWKRLSFLRKVTFRNIFRYKVRMFMTIFGVMGCLTLMFIGFAIRFGVIDISNEQFKIINKIDVLATYNPYAEKEDIDKISKEIGSNSNVENFTKVNVQKATVEKNNNDKLLFKYNTIKIAVHNSEEILNIIKDDSDPRSRLKEKLKINDEAVDYIMSMKINDFTKLSQKDYDSKIKELNDRNTELSGILRDANSVLLQVKIELQSILKKYFKDDKRLTIIGLK